MPVPLLIAGGLYAAKLTSDLIKKGKAKKEAKRLAANRPQYEENPLYQQNLDLAESEVGGLSARGETAYNQLRDKSFSNSLDAILKSGGGANNISELYGEGEEGRLRIAELNDQLRMNQIQNLMRAREQSANQGDKAWQVNVDAPWKDRAQANSEARRSAEEGIWSSVSGLAGLGMQYFGAQENSKNLDKYLKINNQSNSAYRPTNVLQGTTLNPSQMGAGSSMGNMTPYTPNTFNPSIRPSPYVRYREQYSFPGTWTN